MSVTLQTELDNRGLLASFALSGYESTHVLASFPAGVARQCGQGVAREPIFPVEPGQDFGLDPLPEIHTDRAPRVVLEAHAVVFGEKTKQVRDTLVKAAIWVVAPAIDP